MGCLLQGIAHETPAPVALDLDTTFAPPPPPPPIDFLLPVPSVGSLYHVCGLCKPCEFFHRQRCVEGASCKFCHLCGPEERKARRKANKIVKRMQKCEEELATATAAWDQERSKLKKTIDDETARLAAMDAKIERQKSKLASMKESKEGQERAATDKQVSDLKNQLDQLTEVYNALHRLQQEAQLPFYSEQR